MVITCTCPCCGEQNKIIEEMVNDQPPCVGCGKPIALRIDAVAERPVQVMPMDEIRIPASPPCTEDEGGLQPKPERRRRLKPLRKSQILKLLLFLATSVGVLSLCLLGIHWGMEGPDQATRNRAEIAKLDKRLAAFQLAYPNVPHYPPSQIKLCKYLKDYNASPLDDDSKKYLIAMFPGIDDPTAAWSTTGIDWTGNDSKLPVVLEGDQCLVFFLAGIPFDKHGTIWMMGFSTENANPANLTGSRRPVYGFNRERLVCIHDNGFPSYLDHYGSICFAYFSSYGTKGYNPYGNSDCRKLGASPHYKSGGYFNPTTCQIISAGNGQTFDPNILPDHQRYEQANFSFDGR